MLVKSPLAGVSMRQRQSSVTTETQLPVMSSGAASLAANSGGGPGGGWAMTIPVSASRTAASSDAEIRCFTLRLLFLRAQALVHGVNELVGGPDATGFVVDRI